MWFTALKLLDSMCSCVSKTQASNLWLRFSSQEYHLAGIHCYGRYLSSIGLGEEEKGEEGRGEKEKYFQKVEEHGLIVPAVSQ